MRFFNVFMVFLLVGYVSAFDFPGCSGEGEFCTDTLDCCGSLKCWGVTEFTKTCHIGVAPKGFYCSGPGWDSDCQTGLFCAEFGDGNPIYYHTCSECEFPDHTASGVEVPSGGLDNDDCADWGVTCSCDAKVVGNWRLYLVWNPYDDVCNTCDDSDLGNDECYTGLYCNENQAGNRYKCFESQSQNCCTDFDCSSGLYCADTKICTVGTTTTTTTTTTSQTTTTTTLADTVFNCGFLSNISQGIDDVYEIPGFPGTAFGTGDLFDGGELQMYNSTIKENYTLGLTFRNVNTPSGVAVGIATLFLNIKTEEPDGAVFPVWASGYGVKTINNPDFSVGYLPSDVEAYTDDWTGYSIGLDFNGWAGFRVSESVNYTITKNGSWSSGDNLTVILPFYDYAGNKNYNFTAYSYDDDPDLAPRLCMNFTVTTTTTTTLPTSDSECSTDVECSMDSFCATYMAPKNYCYRKIDNYLDNSYSSCYRNHECKSGICSVHSENSQLGDYPAYSNGSFYQSKGMCLPNTFSIDAKTSPSFVVKGEAFDVYASITDQDVVKELSWCRVYFEPVNVSSIFNNTGAWAFSSFGNEWNTTHFMVYNPIADVWNYKTFYSVYSNNSLSMGGYSYWVECRDEDGNIGGTRQTTQLRYQNFTTLQVLEYPVEPMSIYDDFNVRLYYLDVHNSRLGGSDCFVEWNNTNYTLEEQNDKSYLTSLTAPSSGSSIKFEINCNKTTYERANTIAIYSVQPSHCENGVMDFGEEGIDCGGSCKACQELECEPVFNPCVIDSECCTGFCNPLTYQCAVPSCNDGFRNQDEAQVDCGGLLCSPCSLCLINNDCSYDGSSYCDASSYSCVIQNCTVDDECYTLSWYMPETNTYINRQTFCDLSDNICKFDVFKQTNQTVKSTGLSIFPLSGLTSNSSGTIFHVFNCDEQDKLGFRLESNGPTVVAYSFASSSFSPAIPSSTPLRSFDGGQMSDSHYGIISELCTPDDTGIGGIPRNSEVVFAKLNFKSSSGSKSVNQIIDVKVFRNSFKNSLFVRLDTEKSTDSNNKWYYFNSSNRTMVVLVKNNPDGEYKNITGPFSSLIYYNHTAYAETTWLSDMFYYLANTSDGEVIEERYGSPLWMPVEYDEASGKMKLNFTVRWWMIILVVFGIIVYAAIKLDIKDRLRRGGNGE